MKLEKQVALAPLTWWKIGGPAEHFIQPRDQEELEQALQWAQSQSWPVTVLGGGSNVLIPDEGLPGLVISLRELRGLKSEIIPQEEPPFQRLCITALAGTPKSDLTKVFLEHKLAPALFLCGLPGDTGGGVVMNAGVSESIQPREFVEIVDWVEVLRINSENSNEASLLRFANTDLRWTYRHSSGWQPGVIFRVSLSWPLQPQENIMSEVKLATRNRLKKQPLNWPSCGSVFKNPEGYKAGALIEQSGLKGFSIGQAQVSELHSNFIINRGGATAKDVRSLIEHIQNTVRDKFAVELQTEVRFL